MDDSRAPRYRYSFWDFFGTVVAIVTAVLLAKAAMWLPRWVTYTWLGVMTLLTLVVLIATLRRD